MCLGVLSNATALNQGLCSCATKGFACAIAMTALEANANLFFSGEGTNYNV